uniref:N-alpha-acetyltransferase 50, NatE catalytic subunit n=1 Tax=Callithrix jacchus TaxID=9483 RepID=A0A2R8PBW5_CALJA
MKGRIELGDVTPHNIKQLKRLNQVIFPVSYNDKFYKDVLEKNLRVPSAQNADVQKTDN